ncbi:Uncharacterized protein PBTT_09493 [Plasmodiophora brassicae]
MTMKVGLVVVLLGVVSGCPNATELDHADVGLLCSWSIGATIYDPVPTRPFFGGGPGPICPPDLDRPFALCPWTDANGYRHHVYYQPHPCPPPATLIERLGLCPWSDDGGRTQHDPNTVDFSLVGILPECTGTPFADCPYVDEYGVRHEPYYVDPNTL